MPSKTAFTHPPIFKTSSITSPTNACARASLPLRRKQRRLPSWFQPPKQAVCAMDRVKPRRTAIGDACLPRQSAKAATTLYMPDRPGPRYLSGILPTLCLETQSLYRGLCARPALPRGPMALRVGACWQNPVFQAALYLSKPPDRRPFLLDADETTPAIHPSPSSPHVLGPASHQHSRA